VIRTKRENVFTCMVDSESWVECVCCWRLLWQNKEKPLSKLLQRGEDAVFDQVSVCLSVSYWCCSHSVWCRVYATVYCSSVCLLARLSVPSITATTWPVDLLLSTLWAGDIDRQQQPPGATAARHSSANASSVTLSAGIGRWMQTCLLWLGLMALCMRVFSF